LEKAINIEKANYLKACEPVHLKDIPARSNIISSHHFLRVKLESGTYRLKCRMVPHGNRDREKDGIRKDSATAQFCIIRLLLRLAVLLKFRFSSLDISGAYLQAGPIQRDIYVRPPPGWSPRNVLWRLTRPAYGIVESGRLWQLAIEEWLTKQGFSHVNGLSQFFVLRSSDGQILLLLAKVVDDLLVAGSIPSIQDFHNHLCNRFKVGRFVCNESFVFNALQITQDDASFAVTLDMHAFVPKIFLLDISSNRRKDPSLSATADERYQYQSLAGTLNFYGHGVLPPACFAASHLQQQLGNLQVQHLVQANTLVKQLLHLQPVCYYSALPVELQSCHLFALSYAAHVNSYGQSGYVAGIEFKCSTGFSIFHCIDWSSSKQSRVSFSSIGSEILAAASAVDRGYALTASINFLFPSSPVPLQFELNVDSKGLYDTISTLHESKDYRPRPTVTRIRDSFGAQEIRTLRLIPGSSNLADALTKGNFDMFRRLNAVFLKGVLPPFPSSETVDSAT
jgi:Reverse transcriptase (RNA-dependent DNA polymerase)